MTGDRISSVIMQILDELSVAIRGLLRSFKFIGALHKLLTGRVVCRGVRFAPGLGGLRSIPAYL
jgi:hypothetical protein